MDLWTYPISSNNGSQILSNNGSKNFLFIVDDYSIFKWIYFLHTEDQFESIFMSFLHMVERKFFVNIKQVQTYRGGEFQFLSRLHTICFIHQITYPHSSEQNCMVGSRNICVIEKGFALLFQGAIPQKFWTYAIRVAVYTMNRLLCSALDFKVPYTLLYNRLPDYNFLKVFGHYVFLSFVDLTKQKCNLGPLSMCVLDMLLNKGVICALTCLATRFLPLNVSFSMRLYFLLLIYIMINLINKLTLLMLFFLPLCLIIMPILLALALSQVIHLHILSPLLSPINIINPLLSHMHILNPLLSPMHIHSPSLSLYIHHFLSHNMIFLLFFNLILIILFLLILFPLSMTLNLVHSFMITQTNTIWLLGLNQVFLNLNCYLIVPFLLSCYLNLHDMKNLKEFISGKK